MTTLIKCVACQERGALLPLRAFALFNTNMVTAAEVPLHSNGDISYLPNRELTTLTVNDNIRGGGQPATTTSHSVVRRRRMEPQSGVRTVWEHELEQVMAGGYHVPIWDDVDPPTNTDTTTLDIKVDRPTPTSVYYGGSRSRRVMLAMRSDRSPLTMKAVQAGSRMLVRDWEHDQMDLWFTQRCVQLSNWMAAVCLRLKPSPIIFVGALWYAHRLRRLYPVAKGETGCAHRLFCVSLMLATKYHELYWVYQQRLNGRMKGQSRMELPVWWSQVTGGLFSPDELQRMEGEFIGFLGHSLYVPWEELAYFLETCLLPHDGLVPREAELFQELGGSRKEVDFDAVPDVFF